MYISSGLDSKDRIPGSGNYSTRIEKLALPYDLNIETFEDYHKAL